MEKQINVHVPSDYNGTPIQIELREGKALDLFNPSRFAIEGLTLDSILAYINGRSFEESASANNAVVEYSKDPEDAYIKFLSNQTDPFASKLTAKLEMNPDFADFGINKDVFFNQAALIKLVRKHAHCFPSSDVAEQFISNLRNFTLKYEQMIEKSDDRAGKTKSLEETAIKFATGSIALKWQLKMPLFKGLPPIEFEVDLEIEKEDRTNLPKFGFYSMKTDVLLITQAVDAIEGVVKQLRDKFVCLETV